MRKFTAVQWFNGKIIVILRFKMGAVDLKCIGNYLAHYFYLLPIRFISSKVESKCETDHYLKIVKAIVIVHCSIHLLLLLCLSEHQIVFSALIFV